MNARFSWMEFPEAFVRAVLTSEATPQSLRPPANYGDKAFLMPWMDDICAYPDDRFVRRYRREIEDQFLAGTNGILNICKKLKKINARNIILSDDLDAMLSQLKGKRLTATLSDCYLAELRSYGRLTVSKDDSLFTAPKEIDLQAAGGTDNGLYDYQEEAVASLRSHFMEKASSSGILVMPTGSGKTRVTTHFLLRELVSLGFQVIWLTHRAMLIEQAAESFYRLSPLILEKAPDRETFRMTCISGEHAAAQAMQRRDDVIVAGVQTLCRNLDYLPGILRDNVIIVVDEAHHAIAPSYRRIIQTIREKCPRARLLGVTATPVRMNETDTKALMRMFSNQIIYSVSMSELIAKGILSRPRYFSCETNVDIETIINLDEERYIQKWKEMPQSLMEKVARTNERNDLIVEEYIRNRERYGKTLIFALNAIHCIALNDAFRRRGIRSEFVYTLNRDNASVVERFVNNNHPNHIDVLININMLTEGNDIPDIQTVFLTRPTGSDVLLMQMVGRGMRGEGCGGTATVNIVDFCDKWSSITKWMNPRFVLEGTTEEPKEAAPGVKRDTVLIPLDMIRDLVSGITYRNARISGQHTVLPAGWYDVIDADGNDGKVLVFDNQVQGYEQFKAQKENWLEHYSLTGQDVLTQCFGGFGMIPSADELQTMLDMLRNEGRFPVYHRFAERDAIDPYLLSQEYRSGKRQFTNVDADLAELSEKYGPVIQSIFGDMEAYRRRLSDYLFLPNGVRPLGTVTEEVEKAHYKLSETPLAQSIDELLDEVIAEQGANFFQPFVRPAIYWTDKNYGSYFGIYYHDSNEIRINRLLNSETVPVEVVKFVIYHECLHQEFAGHPHSFRKKEHLYPGFQEWENFLDYQLRDFEIEYAM